jgi:hypothetical protein
MLASEPGPIRRIPGERVVKMSNADRLQSKITWYCEKYNILPPFKLSEPYDVDSVSKERYPNSDRPGCYAIFTASDELLYIGKASNNNVMGFRLGAIWHLNADKIAYIPRGDWGGKKPQIIRTIPVNEPYEAPSLEDFLIRELQPPCNTIGRDETEALNAD